MGTNLVVEALFAQRDNLLQEAMEHLDRTDNSIDQLFITLEKNQQVFEQVEEINQKLAGIPETTSKEPGYKDRIEKLMALMEERWKTLKKTKDLTLEHKRRWDTEKEAKSEYSRFEREAVFIDKNV